MTLFQVVRDDMRLFLEGDSAGAHATPGTGEGSGGRWSGTHVIWAFLV